MFWATIVILIFIKEFAVCNGINKTTEGQLVFAQIIYRHGDRNALNTYPNDPWKDESHWPGGIGELTDIGKRQHYELGKFFRRRYRSLLGNGEYSRDKVYIQSTDKDRAIMSAAANLAALFPLEKQNKWIDDVNWQPIPIHTVPLNSDHILAASRNCPRFNYLLKKYYKSPESVEFVRKHQELFRYLEKHTGMAIQSGFEVQPLFDTLSVQLLKNKTLPKWTESVFYAGSEFEIVAIDMLRTFTRTPEMTRLKVGFLLREMFQHFRSKSKSTLDPDRKLWFYSAHDYTISSLLDALGLYDMTWPPYASALMFELYESEGNYYVQVFYRDSDTEIVPPLNIPGCGLKCALSELYALHKEIIPTGNFAAECLYR